MSAEKKSNKKEQEKVFSQWAKNRLDARRRLKQALNDAQNGDFIRQNYEDIRDEFERFYDSNGLVVPEYAFETLEVIYQESDVLQTCIDALKENIDGFGYSLSFLGDDISEKESPEALNQKAMAENFFDQVNDTESFATIRKKMREDVESIGNGAFEVIRNRVGKVQMMFHVPFKRLRISSEKRKETDVEVYITRNGEPVVIKLKRKFNKFAQIDSTGKKLRWFKEFGDPRHLCAVTGEYKTSPKQCKRKATEIWHFRGMGNKTYGLPRWVGPFLQVVGRRFAQYVNYDLFENQGIPPMAVLISGGMLSNESYGELEDVVRGIRGIENWNRVMILEAIGDNKGLDDKNTAKVELKNLSEYRADDQMFNRYLTSTEQDIRHRYRLPDLYVGMSEGFTHSTAAASKSVGEEQVFIPSRGDFDEKVNISLMRKEFGITLWRYKSKGPQIVGAKEISSGVQIFSKVGAFSVNAAIDQANAAFGLDMSKYQEQWANYPIPIVLELLKSGKLIGIEGVENTEPAKRIPEIIPAAPEQKLLPAVTEKMLKSDIFTDAEKGLYRLLLTIQSAIDRGVKIDDITRTDTEG